MDVEIVASQITGGSDRHLNGRFSNDTDSHQHHQQQQKQQVVAAQVSYSYGVNNNRDNMGFGQHQQITTSITCSPPTSDYNVNQPSDGNGKVELAQAAVNLTGNTPIQTRWVKPQGAYPDIDHEIASLQSSYDGLQQAQTNSYYNQDPNPRESYLNQPSVVGSAPSINPTLIDHQESYPIYNRASNWFVAAGEEPTSVCNNNYGHYEMHNQQQQQQENIHTYCQQQINPQSQHQYSMESYDSLRFQAASYTTNGHNFTNYVQNQQNPNFDSNRFQYYDYHLPSVQQANGNQPLQHSNIWTEPNYEHSVIVRGKPESSPNNNLYASFPENRLPDIVSSNQSWPTESNQPVDGEGPDQPQVIDKQHAKFKSSPGQKPCNTKQSSSDAGPTIRTNQCGVCGRNYARPSTLKTHLRTHTNERPFKCNVCLKTFSQAANLTAHQRVHTGERPFSCPICGRQFSQSSSVITHLRTHSGERPYRCSMCSRTFSDSSTLTKHCRIHSGEKPYQCDYCPLNFSQSGNLSRHLKLHSTGTASSSSNSSSSSCSSTSTSSSVTLSSQLSASCGGASVTQSTSSKNRMYASQNDSTISKH